jgi:hypothetical protein
MLKRVKTDIHPFEPDIAQFFGTGDIASEPQNHCVPVLETLHPPNTDDSVILVMPFLRSYNDPPFESIGDVVNFLRQVFEVSQIHISSSFGGFNLMHRAWLSCISKTSHIGRR